MFLPDQDGKFGGGKMYAGDKKLTAATVPGFSIGVDEIFTN